MTLEAIAERIEQQRSASHSPVLIAVEGFGGAGKTTFAGALVKLLGDAYVVHMDDFIIKDRIDRASWDDGVFDRVRLERQVLAPLRSGVEARYQKLLWEAETLSEFMTVPSVRYVVVEGITSYHPDIAHYYDVKIWIHAPIEVAIERGKSRDSGNENEAKWGIWANNDRIYQEQYHPERQADFIYDTTYLV
ncbi:hypothetical protein PV379_00095 [Streptomyces caniscabiei]|uniref:uridine kinase family protein n=1 Tax=Streptomyces caniscabiei TaxID=2746961 RepID=UPI0029B2F9DA|nr:hypothetical protein [Streptomyces caniscabiei]MDX2775761.1 hypothetical protein [Streptomyces caniscabiei]